MKKTQNTVDTTKAYPLDEAIALIPTLSTSKFVGNVDVDVVLNLTEKQKKESIRGSVIFPHLFGTPKRVAVLADERDSATAIAAGADEAGLAELVKKFEAGEINFDVIIATPSVMPQIAKLGRVLGPRGLMPNPANETVTTDLERVISTYKKGKFDFKLGEQAVIRAKVAKVDMPAEEIKANVIALVKSIYQETKKLNSQPFKRITLSPTMGQGVRLDTNEVVSQLS